MAEEEDRIGVAVIDSTVYVKPHGFATQKCSLGIPDFLRAMFRAGCMQVAFDLADCKGMDSTFLGVIADAATAIPHKPGKNVVILNCRASAARQLQRIGLLPLVCVHEEPVEPPEIELSEIDFVHMPKTQLETLERIKSLHQKLIELNEQSRTIFGPFIEMLEEELRQRREDESRA